MSIPFKHCIPAACLISLVLAIACTNPTPVDGDVASTQSKESSCQYEGAGSTLCLEDSTVDNNLPCASPGAGHDNRFTYMVTQDCVPPPGCSPPATPTRYQAANWTGSVNWTAWGRLEWQSDRMCVVDQIHQTCQPNPSDACSVRIADAAGTGILTDYDATGYCSQLGIN
jgi:hypothetical protein